MREVTLRLDDDASFPALVSGVEVANMRLVENDDGTYGLVAEETHRSLRRRGERPFGDVAREKLNEFIEAAEGEDWPPKAQAAFDRLYDWWISRTDASASDEQQERTDG